MSLEQFRSFGKIKEKIANNNHGVMIYTRVSSKDQEQNKSLIVQMEQAKNYARKNNYKVISEFGGTYESASGDFTRKEFMRLINEVRKSKVKPYAILLNTINRFSRSGGSAVSLATELVEELSVHIIDVSTGKNTLTEEGKLEIYKGLLDAKKENLDRMKHTLPGMEKYLREGNWLGMAPRGYDQYGPKVKNIELYSRTQKIVINHEGELIRKAWKWKLQGEKDFEIREKLIHLGIVMTKQAMSDMWRNPFYCGIIAHALLNGDVVKGNWKPIVKPNEFLIIQEILKKNNSGYQVSKIDENRPLMGFVNCSCCGQKLTGYEVKAKGLHYYTCQNKCEGSTMNANSTLKSMKVGINDQFVDLLKTYQLDENLIPAFQGQLLNTIDVFNTDNQDSEKRLKNDLKKLEEQKETLERKHIFEGLPKPTYEKYSLEIDNEISAKNQELQKLGLTISNHDEVIKKCISVSQNLSKYWVSGDVNTKIRIQKIVFPNGIEIDSKNRQYLTKEVNAVFAIIGS